MKIHGPIEPESKPRPPAAIPREKCLQEGCGKAQTHRGLCLSCYRSASRLVRRGKITWEELEAAGQALPAENGPTTNLLRNLKAKGLVD